MRDAAIDTHRQSGRSPARSRPSGAPSLDGMLGEGIASRAPSPASRKGDGITSAAIAAQRLGGGRHGAPDKGRASPGLLARLRARLPRVRPFRTLTITAFSLALVGIVANAMVFQRGRHPAPLFGLGQSLDGQADTAQRTAAAVPAPPAPASVERTGTIPAPVPAAEPAPPPVAVAPKPAPVRHAAAKLHHDDGTAARPKAAGDKAAGDKAAGDKAAGDKAAGDKIAAEKTTPAQAHPRPGHAASKPVAKVEPRIDPVEKLLAEPVRKAKPAAKVADPKAADPKAADAKPVVDKAAGDHHVTADVAVPAHPHHRLAAAEAPAAKTPAAKTTAKTE